jgi:hypothetical protein
MILFVIEQIAFIIKTQKKNRDLVYTYLDSIAMHYKQLIDVTLPDEKEEPESTNSLTL